jgi:hypothetical protein
LETFPQTELDPASGCNKLKSLRNKPARLQAALLQPSGSRPD